MRGSGCWGAWALVVLWMAGCDADPPRPMPSDGGRTHDARPDAGMDASRTPDAEVACFCECGDIPAPTGWTDPATGEPLDPVTTQAEIDACVASCSSLQSDCMKDRCPGLDAVWGELDACMEKSLSLCSSDAQAECHDIWSQRECCINQECNREADDFERCRDERCGEYQDELDNCWSTDPGCLDVATATCVDMGGDGGTGDAGSGDGGMGM